MYDSVIYLISQRMSPNPDTGIPEPDDYQRLLTEEGEPVLDENGEQVVVEAPTPSLSRRKAYAQAESVNRDEWQAGGQNKTRPRVRFKLPRSSYKGEAELEYNGERYKVYRPYTKGNQTELYAEKVTGVTYGG